VKAQNLDMRHYILFLIVLITTGLMVQSCHETPVEPPLKTYPLHLSVTSDNTSAVLNWTTLTVSSFEEYIIVRSEDSIPDSPEPELVGSATIVARIDQADESEFIDFAPPISRSVYYKVYGKIGDRFLSTPTVRTDLSIQIIDLRVDISEINQAKDEFIGYDRANQILFIYNYRTEEIRVQKFIPHTNPIIRIGSYNSNNEIYLTDQSGVMYIYNYGNLNLVRKSNGFAQPVDFIYDKGRFIIAAQSGSIFVMDRATMQITDTDPGIINLRKLYPGERNGDELEILEIGTSQVNKYILENNGISKVSSKTDIPGGFQLITAGHPDGNQFIINGSGKIIDNELQNVGGLEDGVQFYNLLRYTEDGSKLFSAGFFLNKINLKFFDVEDDYDKISENQISAFPINMFSDDEDVYLISVVFLNGGVRTVIFNYTIP